MSTASTGRTHGCNATAQRHFPLAPTGAVHTWLFSTDPDFAAKLDDVARLNINPPRHAVVVSIDERLEVFMRCGCSP